MSEGAQGIAEREAEHLRSRYVLMYGEEQTAVLDAALSYATRMHDGQLRASGEPYIIHPIAVANLLLDMGMDHSTDRKSVV